VDGLARRPARDRADEEHGAGDVHAERLPMTGDHLRAVSDGETDAMSQPARVIGTWKRLVIFGRRTGTVRLTLSESRIETTDDRPFVAYMLAWYGGDGAPTLLAVGDDYRPSLSAYRAGGNVLARDALTFFADDAETAQRRPARPKPPFTFEAWKIMAALADQLTMWVEELEAP
jgi:hypothetical protein